MFLKKNLKKLFSALLLGVILLFLLQHFISYYYIPYIGRKHFAKQLESIATDNLSPVFKVHQIFLFSDVYAENTPASGSSYNWNINLSQYTDVAIYIEKSHTLETLENTIKSISIENIRISETEKGIANLYYKNPLNFGKYIMNDSDKMEDSFTYKIVSTSDDHENLDFSYPFFYNDCSNPITFTYINKNVVKDYAISSDVQSLIFNGHILSEVGISTQDLSATCSLTLHITNYLDENFFFPITFEIPLEIGEKNIIEGKLEHTIIIDKNFYQL